MNWLFPSTIFFLAMSVWLLSIIFASKEFLPVISIACGIVMFIGTGMMWQATYQNTAGVFVLIILFCIILYACPFLWNLLEFKTTTGKNENPLETLVGQKAMTTTCLDPKGMVEINGQMIPATTEGHFVNQGTQVQIIRAGKNILIVEIIEKIV